MSKGVHNTIVYVTCGFHVEYNDEGRTVINLTHICYKPYLYYSIYTIINILDCTLIVSDCCYVLVCHTDVLCGIVSRNMCVSVVIVSHGG